MTRTPAARILGVGHLNTMQSLRRRGRLYGFRRPDSDQYELQFWCGKALLWQVTSLAWEEYRQMPWQRLQRSRTLFSQGSL